MIMIFLVNMSDMRLLCVDLVSLLRFTDVDKA